MEEDRVFCLFDVFCFLKRIFNNCSSNFKFIYLTSATQIVEGLDKMAKETKGKGLRALDDLIKNAHRRGFELQRDCPGDGSCMFHALSDQVARLGIGSIGPLDMREILVQYLEDNPKLVSSITRSLKEECRTLLYDDPWSVKYLLE